MVSQVLFSQSQHHLIFVESKYVFEFRSFEGVGNGTGEGRDLSEEAEGRTDHICCLFLLLMKRIFDRLERSISIAIEQ